MNKKRLLTLALTLAILSTSCLGSFSAFNNLKDWNEQATSNKFVNNLIFWGLNIIPVYEIFFVGDVLIFNVVEFWSGSNPLSMNVGEMETQTIVKNGTTYKMTATKNQLTISVLDGQQAGKSIALVYTPNNQTWSAQTQEGKSFKLATKKDHAYVLYLPDGETVYMAPHTTKEEGLAILNARIKAQNSSPFLAVAP